MQRYKFKAIDDNGKNISGTLAASNPFELASVLKSSGKELISYKLDKQGGGILHFKSLKIAELISALVHLEQLERAGVSIIDSVEDLRDTAESARTRNFMNEIYESLQKGSMLSEAFRAHPNVFSEVYCGLIASSEKTGNLATAFNSIIEDLKWSHDIKRKTRKATLGPLFGIFLSFVVVGVMMTIVVPRVTSFLTAQEITLPFATTALIAVSKFVSSYWYFILGSLPAIYFMFKFLSSVPAIGLVMDHWKLKLPVFGPIIQKIDSAKFCQFFAMTFKGGLGVIECLESSSAVIKNRSIKNSILIVKNQVADGQSLAKSIRESGHFPTLVARMFKVGEESGNMENALQNIKFFYDREINDSIDRLVSMIQPTLTIIMGGMIAWITIAVFGPIYNSFSNIK